MFCQDELAREVRVSKDNVAVNMKKWYLKNYEARFPHIKQDMEVMTYLYIRKYCTSFSGGIPYRFLTYGCTLLCFFSFS